MLSSSKIVHKHRRMKDYEVDHLSMSPGNQNLPYSDREIRLHSTISQAFVDVYSLLR